MANRKPRLNFGTGILYEEVPIIDNPLRRDSTIELDEIQLEREEGYMEDMSDKLGLGLGIKTSDDYLVDLILCKVKFKVREGFREKINWGKVYATFNTFFGILIGILFFIKASIDGGKLSWYGLWLRIAYFALMIVDIHIINPNPEVDTQTKWGYSVPHISGILLTGFQIVGGWSAYGEQCNDFATCL